MTLQERLAQNRKVITAEVTPPHGTNIQHFIEQAKVLKPHVHAVNVTDNQRALMRMSNLTASAVLEQNGCESIYQLTCRDRNLLALQSDLLGARVLGIRNVLALTGDPVTAGDTAAAKGVFQFESVGLLKLIAKLNDGLDVNDKPLDGALGLFPGAVVNPSGRGVEAQLRRMERKIAAGARFFQTQACFSISQFEDFMKKARPMGSKILACVLLIRSVKTARFLQDKVPGIYVPDELLTRLESAKDASQEGIRFAAELAKNYIEMCDGIHLIAIRNEEKIIDVLNMAGLEASRL